jgi:ADP-heptose:LPS heptosyltransferase
MINGPNARPYIASKTDKKWTWKLYQPKPAEVFLTDEEKAFAEPYRGLIMIEPNGKAIGHNNKLWLWDRWLQLVEESTLQFVQCLPHEGYRPLPVFKHVLTPTFRHAMAVLSVARAFVGIEGGLMHAAAALGVPSVILWSEFISPEITGYPQFKNLRHAGKPCGMRVDCVGCRKSMEAITVAEVEQALGEIL